jgi:TonB family protein
MTSAGFAAHFTAALLALAGVCGSTRTARAQATAPDFRTGLCVLPDTTRDGGLSPALSAVVSEPERGPVPLSSTIPPYPPEVRRDGYRGAVVIGFVVDTLGHPVVETAQILESTDPILSRWACGAVTKLRFSPAEHQGRRVFAQAVQPFTYSARVRRRP